MIVDKDKKQYFQGNCKEGRLLIENIKREYDCPNLPRKVTKQLYENDFIFSSSIYFSMKNGYRPSQIIFVQMMNDILPQIDMFNIAHSGYAKDILVTARAAEKLAVNLEKMKYRPKRKEFIYFDVEDYKLYIEKKKTIVYDAAEKKYAYMAKKMVNPKYYKREAPDEIKHTYDERIEEFRKENINRNDKNELKVKGLLDELGIEYEYQKVFYVFGKFYIADFYIPNNNVIIEVDGGYHFTIEQLMKDRMRDNYFAQNGVLTIRIDVNDGNFYGSTKCLLNKVLKDE